jgi:RNA polymerase sigma factor for flagellar operon FliA
MELPLMSLETRHAATTEVDASYEPLVLRHLGLVRRIAYQVARRLPRYVEIEELIQAGMLGLLEAAQRHHASASSFDTYAAYRIRGAILDYLRKLDWRPRSLGRRLREIEKAKCRIENETGVPAKSADVMAALGLSIKDYHRTLRDAAMIPLASLDDPDHIDWESQSNTPFDDSTNPARKLEESEQRRLVAAAIDALPENERVILLLYYDSEVCLREIGNRLDLSESRICQIVGQAVRGLRASILAAERFDREMLLSAGHPVVKL